MEMMAEDGLSPARFYARPPVMPPGTQAGRRRHAKPGAWGDFVVLDRDPPGHPEHAHHLRCVDRRQRREALTGVPLPTSSPSLRVRGFRL